MTRPARAVSIKQLPEKLDTRRWQVFIRELGSSMNVERPCIVLDCSTVREMNEYTAHFLLCCLEGAIKRNGDVRLAAANPAALVDLELAGIARLFKIFDTVDQAVESFHPRATHIDSHGARPAGGSQSPTGAGRQYPLLTQQRGGQWKTPD
jgi:anti-anti-sigma regulatory factor